MSLLLARSISLDSTFKRAIETDKKIHWQTKKSNWICEQMFEKSPACRVPDPKSRVGEPAGPGGQGREKEDIWRPRPGQHSTQLSTRVRQQGTVVLSPFWFFPDLKPPNQIIPVPAPEPIRKLSQVKKWHYRAVAIHYFSRAVYL